MTEVKLLFDADSLVRTWVRRVAGYDIAADVAISLICVPYTEGDHLI